MSNETISQTPKQLGFMMPAEWGKHSAVWLAWPYDDTTFPGRVEKVEQKFVEMISAIHTSEKVELLVLNDEMQTKVTVMLEAAKVDLSKVNFHMVNYQDVWIRDYGPFFLVNHKDKSLASVKFKYNAYGKADDPYFADLLKDNDVFNFITSAPQKFKNEMVLEGGSIEVNGAGTLVTTEQCLLNPNRNPHLSREEIEENLKNYLGVSKIVWLERGLVGDHTDGHVDDIAKFVTSTKIVCAYEDDPKDENYEILKLNYEILKNTNDQNGQPLEVIKLPMPHMKFDDGTKAPVSYTNCYIGNKVILAETFGDKNDAAALKIWQSLFPDRKVVGINCTDIIYGGGAIHCMTAQQPAV